MVWSCLDGSMGKSVYLNDSAQITLGDFCFLAGKPNCEILKTIEVPIITPDDETWQQLIEEEFPDAKRALRYATKKEYFPDIEKLRELASALPEGYHIERIDESNISLLCEDWSRDFISLFENEDNITVIEKFHCSAAHMARLAEEAFKNNDFVDTAYFEPFYLKDFVPGIPKVKGL